MEDLIIGLYRNKIQFKYQYGMLIVGKEKNISHHCTQYNKVEYNHYNDGWWHVEHYYRGYWYCQPFKRMEEVLNFFIEREIENEEE